MSGLCILAPADIGNALSAGMDQGGLLIDEAELGPDFFDLRTGLAGEVLQKFTNYRVRLAIVVADPPAYGSRFSELVHEHRTHNAVRFFATEQLARRWLAYNPVVKC
ncbi:MAG TPA: DUF4180 domain-containing protein [Steroidobacteraceae bacterium]|nr:DUF4180 domain-containing protein [Steroidobacteraceae bacterium]